MKRSKWYPTTNSYLCSIHFKGKYVYKINDQRRLLSSSEPTIFSFSQHLQRPISTGAAPKKRLFKEEPLVVADKSSIEPGPSRSHVDDHSCCVPSPRKMKMMYQQVVQKNVELKKEVKRVKQTAVRTKAYCKL